MYFSTTPVSAQADAQGEAAPNRVSTALDAWLSTNSVGSDSLSPELAEIGLTRVDAERVAKQLWTHWRNEQQLAATKQIADKLVRVSGTALKWLEKRFGDESAESRPLFISMHGGGGAPKRVNDQQWNNQIRLYEPPEGIVIAPRAPGDTWDLWHQGHIDPLFDALITAYVVAERVDPNRVYLMGYSAGGDGVYQLAPRMADRFAAASMMAGHPNESQPLGLRNLPFAIFVGGDDAAYNRNRVAGEWAKKLDDLQQADEDGYEHMTKIYPGKGHWMDREDREALTWMMKFRRQTEPKKIVWRQDDVLHSSFYWLELIAPDKAKAGDEFRVTVTGNEIEITSDGKAKLRLHLSDTLVDLEKPLTIRWNGSEVYSGKPTRSLGNSLRSLTNFRDPARIWSAVVEVEPAEPR